jgi:hypothetical protein
MSAACANVARHAAATTTPGTRALDGVLLTSSSSTEYCFCMSLKLEAVFREEALDLQAILEHHIARYGLTTERVLLVAEEMVQSCFWGAPYLNDFAGTPLEEFGDSLFKFVQAGLRHGPVGTQRKLEDLLESIRCGRAELCEIVTFLLQSIIDGLPAQERNGL